MSRFCSAVASHTAPLTVLTTLCARCLRQLAAALVRCHDEHSVTKFFGACNKYHDELVACFKVRLVAVRCPVPLLSARLIIRRGRMGWHLPTEAKARSYPREQAPGPAGVARGST